MATKVHEVMTERPRAVTRQTPVREAAQLMDQEDIGSVPVVEGTQLVGIVTDRDVAIRVVARGLDPNTAVVGEIASTDVVAAKPDQDLDEALKLMARAQVRRLPIVANENELVGVLAQADIARAGKEKSVGEFVEAISQPRRGPRISGPDVEGPTSERTRVERDDDD